tara:strand:- start:28 stop:441 length:414 start_codon:yes stop_codon:yes gene_type:complete
MGKFFKTADKKLEEAITSRIALEGSKDEKTMRNIKRYNTVKAYSPQFVVDAATKVLISKNKQKHGKFINNTFGDITDTKYKDLTLKSMKKMTLPNIKDVHTKDSLSLVNSGQTYPAAVDDYFKSLKEKAKSNMVASK